MEEQFRTVKRGAFGEILRNLGWELNLWKIGKEIEMKRREREFEEEDDGRKDCVREKGRIACDGSDCMVAKP